MIDPGVRKLPYIASCRFCEQGRLRFARCQACGAVVAMCDECELVWKEIAAVRDDPTTPADGAFPACPLCDWPQAGWDLLTLDDVEQSALAEFVAGQSS